MMKKMITLASLAFMLMAAPASMQAQNIVNADAKVDAKAAKKAEKERLKQEKKAAKEKAKAAKLVAKDATNAAVGATASAITNEFKNEKPALITSGDSTAYLFGISQANGLKAFMANQLKVDTAYINTFARGIMDRVSIDPADKDKIREFDSVKKIYNSLYNDSFGLMDECELERFSGMLQRLINQKIDNSEWGKYDEMCIGEMIALAARIRNNRPVSDPEKEYILAGS